ncbi:MAG TPA: glycosyltransferase [Candidatus Nanoarchaeia archaeon]|nr:glycosyltransferase [Candidatus Nanoarchaeia archaeon]
MISIIIPAYNEEKYLKKTIESISEQTYKDYEIIVVANGCTDNTIEIAQQHADRLFVVDKPHVSIARNIGARHAKCSTLIFLDADTRLAPNALHEINQQLADAAVATLSTYPNAPKFQYYLINAIKNIEHRFNIWKGSSGVIITTAALFSTVGGFDIQKISENHMFIQKCALHGPYKVIDNTYAITSTRRYERWGLCATILFWLANFWKQDAEYEPVR